MAVDRVQRRMAAILAADVVGYSRLMGDDDAATLAALKAHRNELIDGTIAIHNGRIVKLTGDGMLVEFSSVVNAVACAAEIQRRMSERNALVPENQRIEFRIGVNLGDIIVEDNDIFGDGVNVASRIEGIAKPGGVTVSSTVRDHIGKKLDLTFEDKGEQTFKNIDAPVRVYDVRLGVPPAERIVDQANAVQNAVQKEKPSIAVLPFANMSGDAEQEYFADGITEDIITDLSKVSGLSVIARNSVFAYKGTHADVQEVCRRFKVSNVLEGSVRKAGQRVRVNAQLIDGRSGTHLWADRFDRDLTDIFAIQDEITKTIVEQLKVKLLPQERKVIEALPTRNVDAYDYYLQGRNLYHLHTIQHVLLARRMFGKAIELDPGYARAYAGLADAGAFLYLNQYAEVTSEEVLAASARALELGPDLAEAHAARGIALEIAGHSHRAIEAFERAIALDRNLFEAYYNYTETLIALGDWEKAARSYERALEISPDDYRCWVMLAQMYKNLGRMADADAAARAGVEKAEHALARNPDVPLAATLGAGALARLGERDRALEWMTRALTIAPDDALTIYNVACDYVLLGNTEKAIDLLERWVARAKPGALGWLHHDTDLDPIRDHPRFKPLLLLAEADMSARNRS